MKKYSYNVIFNKNKEKYKYINKCYFNKLKNTK